MLGEPHGGFSSEEGGGGVVAASIIHGLIARETGSGGKGKCDLHGAPEPAPMVVGAYGAHKRAE